MPISPPRQGVLVISVIELSWAEQNKQSVTHCRRSVEGRGGHGFFNEYRKRKGTLEVLRSLVGFGFEKDAKSY